MDDENFNTDTDIVSATPASQFSKSVSNSSGQPPKKRSRLYLLSPDDKNPIWYQEAIRQFNILLQDAQGPLSKQKVSTIFRDALDTTNMIVSEKVVEVEQTNLTEDMQEIRRVLDETKQTAEALHSYVTNTTVPKTNLDIPRSYAAAVKASPPSPPNSFELTIMMGRQGRDTKEGFAKTKIDLKQILHNSNPRLRVDSCRQSRTGNIVLTLPSIEDKEKAKEALKSDSLPAPYTLKDSEDRKIALKVAGIYGQDQNELKSELYEMNSELFEAIDSSDMLMFVNEYTSKSTGRKFRMGKLILPVNCARKIITKGKLYSSLSCHRVEIWKPAPQRCPNCLSYDRHNVENCKKICCSHCAGHGHNISACPQKDNPAVIACAPCKANNLPDFHHSITSHECPTWIKSAQNSLSEVNRVLYGNHD